MVIRDICFNYYWIIISLDTSKRRQPVGKTATSFANQVRNYSGEALVYTRLANEWHCRAVEIKKTEGNAGPSESTQSKVWTRKSFFKPISREVQSASWPFHAVALSMIFQAQNSKSRVWWAEQS